MTVKENSSLGGHARKTKRVEIIDNIDDLDNIDMTQQLEEYMNAQETIRDALPCGRTCDVLSHRATRGPGAPRRLRRVGARHGVAGSLLDAPGGRLGPDIRRS